MKSPREDEPPAGTDPINRRTAYLVGAGIVLVTWLLDAGITGGWPMDTLFVRLAWAISLCVCAWMAEHCGHDSADVAGSISSVGSTTAMLLLAFFTGGTSSLYFAMAPFLTILIAQVEPDRTAPTRAAVATTLVGGTALLLAEGESALTWIGWVACALFLGWWATFWLERAQQRRAIALAAERREAKLELDRARALHDLAIADKRRAQAERLAAIGRLASGVAHEINNPLAYVQSNLEMLADLARQRQDGQLLEMAGESLDGVHRIGQIVSDLGGFAREPSAQVERLDADEAIAAAMRLASIPLRRVRHLEQEVAPGLPTVASQAGRVAQVLVNLLNNAADAVAGRPAGRVRIAACCDGGHLAISVDDNGPGIPAELVPHIFDPFFSTKSGKGMGVGLALSREFASQLGGSLELAPSELGGARFVLRLPLDRPHASAAAA